MTTRWLVTTLMLSLCAIPLATAETMLPLAEDWELQSSAKTGAKGKVLSKPDFDASGWYPTQVPRTVLAALVDNGVYPDPYYGENMKSIPGYQDGRWLQMPEDSPFRNPWWYRTAFRLPADYAGRNIVLHLDGINYQANVWLNGKCIAKSDSVIGMFRRFEFDVTDVIRPGEMNALAIETIPPGLFEGDPPRTKQIEATTGWDDHNPQPPDANLGIWEDVYITASGPVRLRYPYVASDLHLPSLETADLTVSAHLTNTTNKEVVCELSGRIEDISFTRKVTLKPDETQEVTFAPAGFPQLTIQHPRVWWPNPVGRQELYEAKLAVSVDGALSDMGATRFGIREADTYIDDEGWRVYRVNGKNILIRGGAWMTADMLLRLDAKRYDALVRYAKESNLNMLRSEGFSIRETDEFYDICDKYGVMVTQQLFGRNIPDERLAIDCIEDTLLRIRTHPSLFHFLGHDETFPTETLDQAYKDLIEKHDVRRTYQPHSGAFEVEERFQTGGTRTGTRELWTYANPTHYYTHKEDGAWGFAQSGGIGGICASLESIQRMMPEDQLWPLWTDAMSFHTVIQSGVYFDALLKGLDRRYGQPSSIEEFVTKCHAMNYESARGMYEAYGRNKFDASGITTWKYDAAWPAALTWQYVDWYLVATGAYYGQKKACEALHVQYSYDDQSVWVVNGLYEDFGGLEVTASVYDFDMTQKEEVSAVMDVAENGTARAFTLEWPEGLSTTFFLKLTLENAAGELVSDNFYWLSTVPDVEGEKGTWRDKVFSITPESTADLTALNDLAPVKLNTWCTFKPEVTETHARVTVENPSDTLAFMVRLAVTRGEGGPEVAPTFWDDNYLCLLPGETKTTNAVCYTTDLGGAAPALKVTGWNAAQ